MSWTNLTLQTNLMDSFYFIFSDPFIRPISSNLNSWDALIELISSHGNMYQYSYLAASFLSLLTDIGNYVYCKRIH